MKTLNFTNGQLSKVLVNGKIDLTVLLSSDQYNDSELLDQIVYLSDELNRVSDIFQSSMKYDIIDDDHRDPLLVERLGNNYQGRSIRNSGIYSDDDNLLNFLNDSSKHVKGGKYRKINLHPEASGQTPLYFNGDNIYYETGYDNLANELAEEYAQYRIEKLEKL